jgi:glycosyltransferase involved in cell wall biosynthesis
MRSLNLTARQLVMNSDVATAAAEARPLRVCTIAYTFYDSDSRVMRYSEALATRGDRVDVIALREQDQPRTSTIHGVNLIGIQTRKINERSQFSYLIRILLFFLRTMVLLSWRHRTLRYDIVHIHSVPDFLVFTAFLPKIMGAKLILDVHDLLPEFYASKFGVRHDSVVFKLLLFLERISAGFADHVITANDLWQQKLVQRSVAAHKSTALLNFPDRSVFQPKGRTRTDDKFIIIYPGSLNWHQGVDIAIEAFAQIKTRVPKAEFHIYGVGPALPGLTKLVETLGLQDSIRFMGLLSLREIARVIENADLGVVPKRNDSFGDEAFSTKILEFMAMGVPAIVSDTKVDSYYFTDTMVKFFKAGSAQELADCMLQLITNGALREALRQCGLEFVRKNCWDSKKELYFALVDSLAGSSGARHSIGTHPVACP